MNAKLFDVTIPDAPARTTPITRLHEAMGQTKGKRVAHLTYIIRSAPFVKIGVSFDVEARFRALLATNPHPLEMVAILAGGVEIERPLHRRFADYHHRDEWFREEGALADWITGGCLAS